MAKIDERRDGAEEHSTKAEILNEWWTNLVRMNAYVLHKPTRVIDRVKAYASDGTEDCKAAIVETETGHKFVATPENFQVLTEAEVQFISLAGHVLTKAIGLNFFG